MLLMLRIQPMAKEMHFSFLPLRMRLIFAFCLMYRSSCFISMKDGKLEMAFIANKITKC